MSKLKFTKGELKRQRDALRQYERFLPTLQLKKQQLQFEISLQLILLEEKKSNLFTKRESALHWAGLLSDEGMEIKKLLGFKETISTSKNIAGVDIPIFEKVEFISVDYDLFTTPLWVDLALEALRELLSLKEEIKVIERSIAVLRRELRITTQRVNLFEKVKIPEAQEAIRLIKIYIGDQMANAVGRCKIAKRKIESLELEAVAL
jgi:V/A-type H+-transporting ATPase subunit D